MQFDPTKPVQTRDGRAARILATDLKGLYPIAVAIATDGGAERVGVRSKDGEYTADSGKHSLDLINVVEKTSTFSPIYKKASGFRCGSLEIARTHGLTNSVQTSPFLGVLELQYEDDAFVGAVFHKEGE